MKRPFLLLLIAGTLSAQQPKPETSTSETQFEKARELYRWYTPLLHLDIPIKFVQYIKLAIQECGLGTEWVRAPRLPLEGREREEILQIIRQGIATRPKIPKAN